MGVSDLINRAGVGRTVGDITLQSECVIAESRGLSNTRKLDVESLVLQPSYKSSIRSLLEVDKTLNNAIICI